MLFLFAAIAAAGLPPAFLSPSPNDLRDIPFDAKWADGPSGDDLRRALPRAVTVAGEVEWRCGIRSDGRLHDCTPETSEPDDPRYAAAGRRMLSRYVVASATVQADASTGSEIAFCHDLQRARPCPRSDGRMPPTFLRACAAATRPTLA